MKRHCEEERRKPARLPAGNLHVITAEKLLRCACLPARRARNEVFAFLLVLFSLTSSATIHTVKQDGSGDHTTIQEGINAASTGDTVLVWPGTYFENIDYNSKSIKVGSLYLTTQDENYIHSTIIDGNMNGSCVLVQNCIGETTAICGFTIQNGSGSTSIEAGGGIFISTSVLTIESCIIQDNKCLTGGGVVCNISHVKLAGSVIKNNIAFKATGGIVIANDSEFIFDSINKNSVFMNYGPKGCDIVRTGSYNEQKIILDTATVIDPDDYFFYSHDSYGNPLNNLTWDIEHGKVEQVNADLYVSVNGNNENSGLTPADPLRTIAFAMRKIVQDSVNPKKIQLEPGTYSTSDNDEIFPICQRSYTSLIGLDLDSTIVDAELLYPLYYSKVGTKNFTLSNIAFSRGYDNNQYTLGIIGGLVFVENSSVIFKNNNVSSSKGYICSAMMANKTEMEISDSKIFNNFGGFPLVLANVQEIPREIKMKNSEVYGNGPGANPDLGRGSAIQYLGTYSYPQATKGIFLNVLICSNTYTEESFSGFGVSGITCINHAQVDFINSTIANNIVTNPVPSAQVYATEGAEINFYNSIVYGTEDYEIFLGDGTPTSDIATINISNTDVKGGQENIQNWNNIHILNWLDGNIDEDPLWEGGEPFSYSLQPGSPCIDAGVPMYETGMEYPYIKEENGKYVLYMLEGDTVTLPAYDLAGNPRISGGRIDMGAYEWQDTVTEVQKFRVQGSGFGVHPNPFTSNVFVSFSLKQEAAVKLEVIDMKGQLIKTITDAGFPSGNYKLVWNGKDDDGYAVKKGNYLMCMYINGTLVKCEKLIKTNQ